MPIVQAVGTCAAAQCPEHEEIAKRVEKAMSRAVQSALDEGILISDDDTIRARIHDAIARERKAAGLTED